MGNARWTYRVELAAEPASVQEARRFVSGLLRAHGLANVADDAELVVSELATNAVTHAGTPFTVTVHRDALRLLVTVQDGTSERPVLVKAGVTETRGRGLAIVDALSQDWGSDERPGTAKAVWASFALPVS